MQHFECATPSYTCLADLHQANELNAEMFMAHTPDPENVRTHIDCMMQKHCPYSQGGCTVYKQGEDPRIRKSARIKGYGGSDATADGFSGPDLSLIRTGTHAQGVASVKRNSAGTHASRAVVALMLQLMGPLALISAFICLAPLTSPYSVTTSLSCSQTPSNMTLVGKPSAQPEHSLS